MARTLQVWLVGWAALGVVGWSAPARGVEPLQLGDAPPLINAPSPESPAAATATDQTLDAALEVQRALGGPAVEQFPQLQAPPTDPPADPANPMTPWYQQFRGGRDAQPTVADPWADSAARRVRAAARGWQAEWQAGEPRFVVQPPVAPRVVVQAVAQDAARTPRPQIAALRGTAAELEATANRLEEVELYEQADAMRDMAQRLRRDARRRIAQARGDQDGPQPQQRPRDARRREPAQWDWPQYVDPPGDAVPSGPPTPTDPPRATLAPTPSAPSGAVIPSPSPMPTDPVDPADPSGRSLQSEPPRLDEPTTPSLLYQAPRVAAPRAEGG